MTTNKIKKISEIADIIDPIKSHGKKNYSLSWGF